MTTYKLTYLNGRGKGESIRWIFAVAGQDYQDIRVEKVDWPKLKPHTPFGQVPFLQFDDVTLCQSKAIARFLSRRFGLAGRTEVEQALVDMVADWTEDLTSPYVRTAFYETDKDIQAKGLAKFYGESLPNYLDKTEAFLKKNNGGDGFFVGDKLTWADIFVAATIDWIHDLDLSKHPKLKALKERVEAYPGIAEWIQKRPVTPF